MLIKILYEKYFIRVILRNVIYLIIQFLIIFIENFASK